MRAVLMVCLTFLVAVPHTTLMHTGCLVLLLAAVQAAPAPLANPMQLATADPDTSVAIRAIKNNDADLAAYLSDPESVCTFFVPTNQAMADWMRWFG